MLTELRRERPEGCLSDLVLDEWSAGELEEGRVRELEAHLATCEGCSARKRARDGEAEAFLARSPSWKRPERAPVVARLSPRSARLIYGSGLAAALALAAGIALFARPAADEGGTRIKGGGASLGFFVKRGARVAIGADGEHVRPGDVLRFTVSSERPRHVAVFGLDARGVASVYYPADGVTHPSGPGRGVPLDVGVELDDTLGEERLFALFCDDPIAVEEARKELERTRGVATRAGCSLDVLRLEKERAP